MRHNGGNMAKGSMNTGPGNYRAPVMGESAKQLREALKGITPTKHPNRNLSSMEYKKSLKKESESDA